MSRPASFWAELESALQGQLTLAHEGDFDRVFAGMPALMRLLDHMRDPPSALETVEAAARIQHAYHELCLALQSERAEIARHLRRMGQGRQALKAYRGT